MKIKNTGLILLLGISFSSGYADVVNGQVDDQILYDASSINVADDLDIGWSAYAASEYELKYQDITRGDNEATTAQSWFGQIFTDNNSTYGAGILEFDIDYINQISPDAMFHYAIYGTDSTDGSATSFALNTDGNPLGETTAWNLMDSGSVSITGLMTDHQEILSLGNTSYDYIAVRFRLDAPRAASSRDPGSIGADNISVVPEPAAIGLLGLGGVAMLIANRIRRRNA